MGLGRFLTALSVVALGDRVSAATPGVLQIPFTTDAVISLNDPGGQYGEPGKLTYILQAHKAGMGQYGPDGPWQAVALSVGDFGTINSTRNPYSGVWPVINNWTWLLDRSAGGNFTASQQRNNPENRPKLVSFNPPDSSIYFTNATMEYEGHNLNQSSVLVTEASGEGLLSFHRLMGTSIMDSVAFKTDIVPMTSWEPSLRNGKKHSLKTGLLGMKGVLNSLTGNGCSTACTLEEIVNRDVIGSRTFSLHIGSTITEQQGSFALGGYEATRIAGPMGVFDLMDDKPIVFLRDLFLGVESGYSPFLTDRTDNISVFHGQPFGDPRSPDLNAKLRASPGSVVVTPNAAAPGIYLPDYLCAKLSEYFPVFLDLDTGYYLWDTASPFYTIVVNSAGYLGFVLSDRNARNITIKVPFILLNLDLEPPLVPVPRKYFPCHPTPSSPSGHWLLGRAFLQAAFLGYSMDQNLAYLAQAPGPDVAQSIVRAWKPESVGVDDAASLPPDAWYQSWARHMSRLNSTLDRVSGVPLPETPDAGKVDGKTVGGIIGGVVGAIVLLLGVWQVGYRLRRGRGSGGRGGAVELGEGRGEVVELGEEKVFEKGMDVMRFEMGDGTTFELGAGRDGAEKDDTGSAEAEGTEETAETEIAVVKRGLSLEEPGVFEMPGAEPLGRHGLGRENEVDAGSDQRQDGTTSRRENVGEIDDVYKARS